MTRSIRFSPLLAAGVFAGLFASPCAASDLPFTAHQTISTSAQRVYGLAAADVDGDGDLDALSASYMDDKVAWYENTAGDGSVWTTHTITTAADGAVGVFAADVDRDGDVDVLSASRRDDTVAWYENVTGNGSAWIAHAITITADGAQSAFTADVDRDGDPDVVVASALDNTIAWYENVPGNMTVWPAHTISTAALAAQSAVAADVDRDGDLDVVSGSFADDKVAWYENTAGNGSAWTVHTIALDADGARSVAVADLDRDGDADVLRAGESDDSVVWYENAAGNGSAWTARTITTTAQGASTVFVADLDGDGDRDVLSASRFDDTVAWYENTAGNGSIWTTRTISTAHPSASAALAADVDGDGDPDVLVAASNANRAAWHENVSIHEGAVHDPAAAIFTAAGPQALGEPADIDGDGDADVLLAAGFTTVLYWSENTAGDGSAWSAHAINTLLSTIGPELVASVQAADVDRDGDLDVMFGSFFNLADSVAGWMENAAGDGTLWVRHTIGTVGFGDIPLSVMAADVDRDGDLDAVAVTAFGLRVWFEGAGNGSTWTSHPIAPAAAYTYHFGRTGDLDRDGDVDLVFTSTEDDYVLWYENNGSAWTVHTITTSVDGAAGITISDVDGDGDPDVVISSSFGTVAWHENTVGNASAWVRHTVATTTQLPVAWAAAADVDRDGDADLLFTTRNGGPTPPPGTLGWHENTAGDASAWNLHTLPVGISPFHIMASDLDGDGRPDLLCDGCGNDIPFAWYRSRGGQFALTATDTAPPTAGNGALVPMLRIDAAHLGRPGDGDLELATLGLLFEADPGVPLTSAQANALVESLRVYRDANGNGIFDPAADALVVSLPTLTLAAGVQTVTFADGDPQVQVAQGASRTYFVVVELTANASGQAPNRLRVTHLGLGPSASTAEQRDFDIPLRPAAPANVASSFRQVVPVELLGFRIE